MEGVFSEEHRQVNFRNGYSIGQKQLRTNRNWYKTICWMLDSILQMRNRHVEFTLMFSLR